MIDLLRALRGEGAALPVKGRTTTIKNKTLKPTS